MEKKDKRGVSLKNWMEFFNFGLGKIGVILIMIFGAIGGILALVPSYIIGLWGEQSNEEHNDL